MCDMFILLSLHVSSLLFGEELISMETQWGGVLKMLNFRSQSTFGLSRAVRSVATGNQWSRINFKTDFIGALQRFPVATDWISD